VVELVCTVTMTLKMAVLASIIGAVGEVYPRVGLIRVRVRVRVSG